jgi:NAD-dependent dihydropyrimidine dehydrogenase PreA subunit
MTLRKIIDIDEELCDGCGQCVPSCHEGALQIINGKARLVSDVLCDGLGACLGECPTGALTVSEREAPEFDQAEVARRSSRKAAVRLPMANLPLPAAVKAPAARAAIHVVGDSHLGGCPGSRVQSFDNPAPSRSSNTAGGEPRPSRLRQWPIQLHLVPPTAPYFQRANLLLAADCVPFAVADFHDRFLDGRALAIACPKLDQHMEIYVEKLTAMIDEAGIDTLTVAIMEVPCCGGLVRLAQQAVAAATRKVPIKVVQVGVRGDVQMERWM